MFDSDGPAYPPSAAEDRGVNPWLALALVLGIVAGLVLLVVWGASASPGGGCGGG